MTEKNPFYTENDAMILRKGIGTNPTGDRLVYDVKQHPAKLGFNLILNSGAVAMNGAEGVSQNLYPREGGPGKAFMLSEKITNTYFVKFG